ncbi:MAG: hypothetical protein LCH38_03540 [Proteobacteria bacterium]|nr:hypothetical protein [Pseudomonadota bacterium]
MHSTKRDFTGNFSDGWLTRYFGPEMLSGHSDELFAILEYVACEVVLYFAIRKLAVPALNY